MRLDKIQADKLSGGIFLIGMGILFYTGRWWPGIMFVIGAASIPEGLAKGRGWYGLQGAAWFFGLGLIFLFQVHFLAALFILLGVSAILGVLVRPPYFAGKPHVDNTLE